MTATGYMKMEERVTTEWHDSAIDPDELLEELSRCGKDAPATGVGCSAPGSVAKHSYCRTGAEGVSERRGHKPPRRTQVSHIDVLKQVAMKK